MEPTEISQDISCGQAYDQHGIVQGMGLEVQLHQWSMTKENIVSVSAGAGAIEMTPGGIGIGYASIIPQPVFAEGLPLPTSLGGVSLRITDSEGVARLAPLLFAGPSSINFLIDAETALGMASVTLLRDNGEPGLEGCVLISRVAPGFFTANMNARGPVVGESLQRLPDGTRASKSLYACDEVRCWSVPVDVAGDGSTQVRIYGSGFRRASAESLHATIGGRPVRILDVAAQPEITYNDQLVLAIGPEFAGLGEEDIVFWAGSRVSNVVRIHLR